MGRVISQQSLVSSWEESFKLVPRLCQGTYYPEALRRPKMEAEPPDMRYQAERGNK